MTTTWNYKNITSIENPLNLEDNTDRLLENSEIRLIEYSGILWDNINKNTSNWSEITRNNTVWSNPIKN
jgi:hypothetical protein